jgi:hypothetical protein
MLFREPFIRHLPRKRRLPPPQVVTIINREPSNQYV